MLATSSLPNSVMSTLTTGGHRTQQQGYCQLQTTKGNINVEIHCDIVPRMSENFLGLCEKEYYDGTEFHRSIRNFMLQVRCLRTYGFLCPGIMVHSGYRVLRRCRCRWRCFGLVVYGTQNEKDAGTITTPRSSTSIFFFLF